VEQQVRQELVEAQVQGEQAEQVVLMEIQEISINGDIALEVQLPHL